MTRISVVCAQVVDKRLCNASSESTKESAMKRDQQGDQTLSVKARILSVRVPI